jgi:nucleoside-diphosphate-sugar epimerase
LLGAGGFLGLELSSRLATENIPVRAVSSKEIDLTGGEAVERLAALIRTDDAIVMTACIPPEKGRDIAALMNNIRMAESLAGAILRKAPTHLLYVSSDAVYDARHSKLLNEDSSCEPISLYALAHVAREKMLENACGSQDIPFVVVRPCAIYGARDTHNSYGPNRFIRNALETGKITLFGNGEERRHHVCVADVAKIIELCLLHRSVGTINAVTGEAVSFHTVASMVISAIERPILLERAARSNPITHRHFDTTALIKACPDFRATALSDGIARTVFEMIQGDSNHREN